MLIRELGRAAVFHLFLSSHVFSSPSFPYSPVPFTSYSPVSYHRCYSFILHPLLLPSLFYRCFFFLLSIIAVFYIYLMYLFLSFLILFVHDPLYCNVHVIRSFFLPLFTFSVSITFTCIFTLSSLVYHFSFFFFLSPVLFSPFREWRGGPSGAVVGVAGTVRYVCLNSWLSFV